MLHQLQSTLEPSIDKDISVLLDSILALAPDTKPCYISTLLDNSVPCYMVISNFCLAEIHAQLLKIFMRRATEVQIISAQQQFIAMPSQWGTEF